MNECHLISHHWSNKEFETSLSLTEGFILCDGVSTMELNGKLYHHVIPLIHETFGEEKEHQFPQKGFWRAKGCFLFVSKLPLL